MDQQKTGEFLRYLRKEKGLTQEQLGERFYVSSRTISRWETGSNLPDVGTLIALADFYGVDIRELIDGERNHVATDPQMKETLRKVAEYAAEGEKPNRSPVLYTALGVSVMLGVCTLLFSTGATGLLCGIIPENVCYYIMAVVYGLAFFLLLFYLRVLPFREKPASEPKKTVAATVISREVRPGTNRSGRSQAGYSFVVGFRTESGEMLELYTYDVEYGGLREEMQGILTYQGRYFVSFRKREEIE